MYFKIKDRSSRLAVFRKKDALENFTKFTGKHLCQSLFFNKVPGITPATLLKKRLAQVFSCEFCEIFKNTFFYRTSPVAASERVFFSGKSILTHFISLISFYPPRKCEKTSVFYVFTSYKMRPVA